MSYRRTIARAAVVGACAALLLSGLAVARETIEIRSGTILAVDGDRLTVDGPEGVKVYTVPPDFRFDMNGRMLTVDDLEPGMPISAMITTIETPVEMTKTEVRDATVIHTIGSAFVVQTEDGVNRKFTSHEIEERGIHIFKDGKQITPWDLKKGDKVTATIVSKLPPQTVTEQELLVFVDKKPEPRPVMIAEVRPQPKPAPAPQARQLPKTASDLPWLAVSGGLALVLGAGLTLRRTLFG